MAFKPVQVIEAPDKVVTKKAKQGGGAMGQKLGMVVGGIAGGLATGGSGAIQGAAAGGALGATLGGMAQPGREGSTAIERRMQTSGPQIIQSETSNKLKESLMALHEAPQEARAQYAQPLLQAYMASLAKDNQKVG